MVLVFILLILIMLLVLFATLTTFSTLKIEIRDFENSNYTKVDSKNYKIKISLYLLEKIKWFSIKINNERMQKMYSKMQLEKIDLKKLEKDLNINIKSIKELKKLNLKLSYLDLDLQIGLEEVISTTFLVTFISTAISILLPFIAKKDNKEYSYSILPLYINKNAYKIKFNCIIEVKMVHIINIIYLFLKKGKSDKNERTSNRKSYDYSYE